MTPLVFVHGFMGGSAQWALQAPLGASRDLITLDLPGFGANADLPAIDSIAGFATWALSEIRRRGVEQFHLMGHSMGGMIVQEMVRQAPDRVDKLIIYGSGPSGDLPGRFETFDTSKRRFAEDGVEATARRISATWFLDFEAAAEYPNCAAIACESAPAALPAALDAMKAWDGVSALPQISSDTLIIWGDGDRTYKWPQIHRLWSDIPGASLAVIPKCAHATHLEAPEIFNDCVDRFLRA